jgi:hypothetical protein
MKKQYLAPLLLFISSCGQPSIPNETDTQIRDTGQIPSAAYSIIDSRTDTGGQFYDIYIKDST